VSIVTLGEVFEGAYHHPNPQQHLAGFRRFLSGFTILGLSDPIMELFAQTRHTLRRQGNLIPDLDLLIGATAVHHGVIVMTRNRRHFSRIPGLQLYSS
jgi:predicted nucleic acid-binding protein